MKVYSLPTNDVYPSHRCPDDTTIIGGTNGMDIMCKEGGTWSRSFPQCKGKGP